VQAIKELRGIMSNKTDPRDEPRSEQWKALMARLYAAYKEGGAAALEKMLPIETLALWNEKVRDFRLLNEQLQARPDEAMRQQRESLLKEISAIGSWVNAKQRGQQRGREMDMDR
jgi:hypothetical protein